MMQFLIIFRIYIKNKWKYLVFKDTSLLKINYSNKNIKINQFYVHKLAYINSDSVNFLKIISHDAIFNNI